MEDDLAGAPFASVAGKLILDTLVRFNISLDHVRMNNVIRCAPYRPKKQRIEKPSKKEIFACTPSLLADIEATKPRVVIALGDVAKKALLRTTVSITHMRGAVQTIQAGSYSVPCVPVYSPAYLSSRNMPRDLVMQWVGDIRRAINVAVGKEAIVQIPKDFRVLDSIKEINDYVAFLADGVQRKTIPYIVTDIEASGLNPHFPEQELLLLGITHAPHQSVIVPVDHFESPLRGRSEEIGNALRPLGQMPLANQNIKFDYQWYRRKLKIIMEQIVFDTMFANHAVYQTTRANDLESLGAIHLNEPAWSYRLKEVVASRRTEIKKALAVWKKEFKKQYKKGMVAPEVQAAIDCWTAWQVAGKQGLGYGVAPMQDLAYYCSIDCDVTYRLVPVLRRMLIENNLMDTYQRMYMTHIGPWCDIQYEGIYIDQGAVDKHCVEFPKKLIKIKADFNELPQVIKTRGLLGRDDLNINSPPQIATLVYDVMKSPAPSDKRKGKRTTDAEQLKQLKGAAKRKETEKGTSDAKVFSAIMDFRGVSKNFSSYVSGLGKFTFEGHINPNWNIAGTDTGRASCKEPPVHSQPYDLRDIVRSRYHDIGGSILYFDQSQIEVRVFGSIANDPFLIQTYNTPGADIHRMLAGMLFSKAPEDVTDEERQIAKTCVFASFYGGGPGRIAGQTGMALPGAKMVHARFTSIITLDQFKEFTWNQLLRYGHVKTPFGRIRVIPIPESEKKQYHARNQCINTPIQSVASDVTEESITRLWWRMRQAKMKSKIIIWHHDAIVWDVYPGELLALIAMAEVAMVTEPMQMYDWLRVPLKIEGGFGVSWRDTLEVTEQAGSQVTVEGKLGVYQALINSPFHTSNPSTVTKQWKKNDKDMVQAVFNIAA